MCILSKLLTKILFLSDARKKNRQLDEVLKFISRLHLELT